jgi:predicted FMN-binding regulatory protein PaiB
VRNAPKHQIPDYLADEFVAGQKHGTLIATSEDGFPQVTILPFLRGGDTIEIHCVQADPTFAALRANPRVTFFVSDYLTYHPYDWVDPVDRARVSIAYRAVNFECSATFDLDPNSVAAALTRLVRAYEPEANYPPLPNDEFYGPRIRQLAVVQLKIIRSQAKFKIGPSGVSEGPQRANVAAELRKRALPGDERAAYWIDYYNDLRRVDGQWRAPGGPNDGLKIQNR